jgi:hypothetical protein
MTKTYIPEMAKELVDELGKRIRPTVKIEGKLCYMVSAYILGTNQSIFSSNIPTSLNKGI